MIRSSSNGDNQDDLEDPSGPSTTNGGGRESSLSFKINEVQFPLVLVFATSFLLMLAVLTWKGPMSSRGYAIAVPSLSLALSLSYILLTIFKEQIYTMYGKHMTHLLFIWNFTGACFLTFSSPFTTTGNGYFAAWGCVAASAMAMGFTGDGVRTRLEGLGPLLGLCGSAGIVIIALIDFVGPTGGIFRSGSIYAMVVSIFTIIFVGGIIYYERTLAQEPPKWFSRVKFGLLAFFALLWLILACLVTFSGPFATTGNGYFASWAGLACIGFASFAAWVEMGVSTEDIIGFLTPASNSDQTGLSATIS